MTIRGTAAAVALLVALSGCIPPTVERPASPTAPASTGSPSPSASRIPSSPAPTPATVLALSSADRPSGPRAVTFQAIGSEAIREVYVLAPVCPEPACDLEATVQTFAGEPLGTALFRFADGMYRYEGDRQASVACNDGVAVVPDGAVATSHTSLLIAGYRPTGTAVVTVDIRGSRTVSIEPVPGSTCGAAELEYTANGEPTEFAAAPTPTPKPPADPKVPTIQASFFGSGTTLVSYRVGGATITQIVAAIRADGPWSDWIHARAEALTKAVPKYRFDLVGTSGSCRIDVRSKPAVVFTFTITLPAWSRPKSADAATVRWWAGELLRVATHERHHVEIYRDGAARMSDAVIHSGCATLPGKLAAIVRDIDVQQCEFDLQEYGTALGLTLGSCLNR